MVSTLFPLITSVVSLLAAEQYSQAHRNAVERNRIQPHVCCIIPVALLRPHKQRTPQQQGARPLLATCLALLRGLTMR